jgi:hypothetical protein
MPGTKEHVSDTHTELPGLAWDEADVHDGELQLPLTAEAPRGWAARFRELLERLGDDDGEGRWGKVSVSRSEVKVADVAEGGEKDLRHLLESVLLQVNTDFAPEDEQRAAPSPGQQRDARLAESFRAFADGA